jgi:hypothetical protein
MNYQMSSNLPSNTSSTPLHTFGHHGDHQDGFERRHHQHQPRHRPQFDLDRQEWANASSHERLTRLATSSRFKKRYRILLDINDYKTANTTRSSPSPSGPPKKCSGTHIDATLEPMPADERRMVHNALSAFHNIKTESEGDGRQRAIVIRYVE